MAQQEDQQTVENGVGSSNIIDISTEEFVSKYLNQERFEVEEPFETGSPSTWSFKLNEGERISKVMINNSEYVNGITFEISNISGATRNEGLSGADGTVSEIVLSPEEHITQLSGFCRYHMRANGFYIVALRIYTNLRPTQGYGPYGLIDDQPLGDYFTTPVPTNGPIIGFFGSQRLFLEFIGFHVGIQTADQYGPFGSQSPRGWSFQLNEGQRIIKIMIRHGFIVDGIGFEISNANGRPATNWYSGRGGRRSEIALKSYEFITQISGTHGNYIHNQGQLQIASLKIHTNIRPQGYGPYGFGKDVQHIVPFSTPVQLGGPITGFFGQGTTYLGSIGIHVNPHKYFDLSCTQDSLSSKWSIEIAPWERLEKVMIRHGAIVDGIGFQVSNGYMIDTKWFGGNGGSIDEITLKEDEIITQISGTHGNYHRGSHSIASMRIHTNLRPDGYGPYGQARRVSNLKSFRTLVPIVGGAITGFSGAYGNYLDSIDVTIKPGEMIEQHGPYGPNNSTNWSFRLGKNEEIQSIMIRHSVLVHGIGISTPMKFANGRGELNNTQWFSRRLGTVSTITLEQDEYITQISGTYASLLIGTPAIASLRIHTNLKPEGHGPYGGTSGLTNRVAFSTPVPLGGPIAGFVGSTRGEYLYSIGIYSKVYSEPNVVAWN